MARPPLLVLAAAIAALVFAPVCASQGSSAAPRVFLVLVDRVSLEELVRFAGPSLSLVLSQGAVGLMSTRTGGKRSPEACYVTLGAGARAVAGEEAYTAFDAGARLEEGLASEVYRVRTGRPAAPGSVVHLGIARLAAGNREGPYRATPGWLGSALKEAGFSTAVVGNADLPREVKRHAACVVMDRYGVVDAGSVGRELLAPDPEAPHGLATDVGRLMARVRQLAERASVVVVETGDTARAEDLAQDVEPAALEVHKRRALERVDAVVGGIMSVMSDRDRLLIVTPCPSLSAMERGDYLTPVVAWGGSSAAGLLTSASTRRPGMVLNTDVAPTVLDYLGVEWRQGASGAASGMPFEEVRRRGALRTLLGMSRSMAADYLARGGVLEAYVTFQALLAVGCGLMIAWGRGRALLLLPTARRALLLVLAFPAGFLIQGLLGNAPGAGWVHGGSVALSTVTATAIAAAICAGASGLGRLVARRTRGSPGLLAIGFVAAATWFLLAADLVLGCPMQRWSFMSYSPVIGARFYGIGNEYMGVMVSAAAAGMGLLADGLGRSGYSGVAGRLVVPTMGVLYVLTVVLVAAPWWGANFGGAITAVATLGLVAAARLRSDGRIRGRDVVSVLVGAGILAVALLLLDAVGGVGRASHMGRAALAAWSGGFPALLGMASRKLSTNLKLIAYTMWTRPLLAFLVVVPYLFHRPVGVLADVFRSSPWFAAGAAGCAVGAVVAFLANDSGVVAAATTSLFSAFGVVAAVLESDRLGRRG